MTHIDDIRVVTGDDPEQPGERSRPIGHPHGEGGEAPGSSEAMADHPHQQQRIDIAARQCRDDGSLDFAGLIEQRRDSSRSRGFDDKFGALQQQ